MAAYATPFTGSAEPTSAPGGSGFLTRDEVMTAREVAELLRMPTSTVYEGSRPVVRFRRASHCRARPERWAARAVATFVACSSRTSASVSWARCCL
jgi:hypothetical protein